MSFLPYHLKISGGRAALSGVKSRKASGHAWLHFTRFGSALSLKQFIYNIEVYMYRMFAKWVLRANICVLSRFWEYVCCLQRIAVCMLCRYLCNTDFGILRLGFIRVDIPNMCLQEIFWWNVFWVRFFILKTFAS